MLEEILTFFSSIPRVGDLLIEQPPQASSALIYFLEFSTFIKSSEAASAN
jgi:hypothetical protein